MAPHRAPTLASYTLGSLAKLPAILSDPTTTVPAVILGVMSWWVGASNLRLLNIVLAAMVLNLLVGALWAVIDPRERFSIAKLYGGLLGKIFRLLVIPVASIADQLLIVSPFGGDNSAAATFPIVASIMWALAIAEIVSSFEKFVEAGVIPEHLMGLIRRLQTRRPPMPAAPPEHQEAR